MVEAGLPHIGELGSAHGFHRRAGRRTVHSQLEVHSQRKTRLASAPQARA